MYTVYEVLFIVLNEVNMTVLTLIEWISVNGLWVG